MNDRLDITDASRATAFDSTNGGGSTMPEDDDGTAAHVRPRICGKLFAVVHSAGQHDIEIDSKNNVTSITVAAGGSLVLQLESGTLLKFQPGTHARADICKIVRPGRRGIDGRPVPSLQPTASTSPRL